jgi:hypothetical protein
VDCGLSSPPPRTEVDGSHILYSGAGQQADFLGRWRQKGGEAKEEICSMRAAVTGSTNIREDLVRETKSKARRRVHSTRKGLGTGQNQGLASDARWSKLASEKTGFACKLF